MTEFIDYEHFVAKGFYFLLENFVHIDAGKIEFVGQLTNKWGVFEKQRRTET